VTGHEGKTAVDATNIFVPRPTAFPSLAAQVNSITSGPVAESFNLNFASLYGQIAAQRVRPPACMPPTRTPGRSPSGSSPAPGTSRPSSAASTGHAT